MTRTPFSSSPSLPRDIVSRPIVLSRVDGTAHRIPVKVESGRHSPFAELETNRNRQQGENGSDRGCNVPGWPSEVNDGTGSVEQQASVEFVFAFGIEVCPDCGEDEAGYPEYGFHFNASLFCLQAAFWSISVWKELGCENREVS